MFPFTLGGKHLAFKIGNVVILKCFWQKIRLIPSGAGCLSVEYAGRLVVCVTRLAA